MLKLERKKYQVINTVNIFHVYNTIKFYQGIIEISVIIYNNIVRNNFLTKVTISICKVLLRIYTHFEKKKS